MLDNIILRQQGYFEKIRQEFQGSFDFSIVKAGDFVKTKVEVGKCEAGHTIHEYMWLKVTESDMSKKLITGTLNNIPLYKESKVKLDDVITIKHRNTYQYLPSNYEQ